LCRKVSARYRGLHCPVGEDGVLSKNMCNAWLWLEGALGRISKSNYHIPVTPALLTACFPPCLFLFMQITELAKTDVRAASIIYLSVENCRRSDERLNVSARRSSHVLMILLGTNIPFTIWTSRSIKHFGSKGRRFRATRL
jgi:hypothetical protein